MPQLVGKEVGPIGFGLMGFTWREEPCSEEQAFAAMRAALQNGCNFWNGGEFYGPEERNSLVLLERYFARYPEDADKVVLSIKGGALKPYRHQYDSSPANVRRSVEDCTAQLAGRKVIDLFEVARHDGVTPWETTLETLDREFVQTGKIHGISLSEVRAETIHRAAKVTKISAVEVELSLMSTEVLSNGVADACAQHGIPLIAYSPISRGMLAGHLKSYEDLPPALRFFPRFSKENFPVNVQLVDEVIRLAAKKGCTPAQLAINWTRCLSQHRPGMPTVIPIPGGTTPEKVVENARLVDITKEEMDEIDAILAKLEVKGDRYPPGIPVNT